MKKYLKSVRQNADKIALASFVVGASSSASAALPTAALDALTAAATSVTDTETAVWPIIAAALVAGITIKLVKRFSGAI